MYGVDYCVVLLILFWALFHVSDKIRGCVYYVTYAVIFPDVQKCFLDLLIR